MNKEYAVEIQNRALGSYRAEGHFKSASEAARHALKLAGSSRSFCLFRVVEITHPSGGRPVNEWIEGVK